MCYWVGTKKVREALKNRHKENPEEDIPQLYYNTMEDNPNFELIERTVAIGKAAPTLSVVQLNDHGLNFDKQTWGLQWKYFDRRKKESVAGKTQINSTAENLFMHHNKSALENRCVLPASGYWEFYHHQGKTYPFYLTPKRGGLFYFAGISNSTDTENPNSSFSLITTEANAIGRLIHNNPNAPNGARMLCPIQPDRVLDYLNPSLGRADLERFFTIPEPDMLDYHPTQSFLKKQNQHLVQNGSIVEAHAYPELSSVWEKGKPVQGSLFDF